MYELEAKKKRLAKKKEKKRLAYLNIQKYNFMPLNMLYKKTTD